MLIRSQPNGLVTVTRLFDLTGMRFNRWSVVRRVENSKAGQTRWLCKCDCGTGGVVQAAALKTGHSKSCGCLIVETTIKRSTKHGHATNGISNTYKTWAGMMSRCSDANNDRFFDYGGRGISVHARWHKFEGFLADMGEKPKGSSIDRINVNGNYEPGNCRWATHTQQARNKRNNRLVTALGQTMCVADWAERTGLRSNTIIDRLKAGWSDHDAVTKPVDIIGNRKHRHLITLNGNTKPVSEWAKELGIPAHRIYHRALRGWPPEKVLSR